MQTLEAPALVALKRDSNNHTTPAELRALLKQTLGINARQVSVSKGHSYTWLTITVRDASVDLEAVKAFASPFDTSQTDVTDYHTGQSVEVTTTKEVDAVHAAPHVEDIKRAIAVIVSGSQGCGVQLANGKYLWRSAERGGDYYVLRDLNGVHRGCYIWGADVEQGTNWAIEALALQAARV